MENHGSYSISLTLLCYDLYAHKSFVIETEQIFSETDPDLINNITIVILRNNFGKNIRANYDLLNCHFFRRRLDAIFYNIRSSCMD